MEPRMKFPELLSFVRKFSPFYRELYAHLPENIQSVEALPVLVQDAFWKANVLGNDPHGSRVLTGPMKDGIVFKSGGTTGNPKFSVFAKNEWKVFNEVFGRSFAAGILEAEDRVANLFYVGQLYGSFLFITKSMDECPNAVLQLPVGGGTDFEETHQILRDFQVTVLAGVPTTILNLADHIRRKGLSRKGAEQLAIRKILFGGEAMHPDQRESLAEVFPGVQIHSIGYASTDAGLIGYADRGCRPNEHRSFSQHTILEILDEESHAVIEEPGKEGLIVLTNLTRQLMPIIRYPVGDRGSWVEQAGTPDRKYALLGRSEESARIGLVKLYVDDIRSILLGLKEQLRGADFQMIVIHRERIDGLVLRIVTSGLEGELERLPALEKEIIRAIHANRPLYEQFVNEAKVHPIVIEWVRPGMLETNPRTGKLRRVIDRRFNT
jgi:phenylacetate-CoA ligase